MIRIQISENGKDIQSLKISGHALAGDYGSDLTCCAVSSIAISGINAIDEMFPGLCDLKCTDNEISVQVLNPDPSLQTALKMLNTQLKCMQEADPKHISMKIRSL